MLPLLNQRVSSYQYSKEIAREEFLKSVDDFGDDHKYKFLIVTNSLRFMDTYLASVIDDIVNDNDLRLEVKFDVNSFLDIADMHLITSPSPRIHKRGLALQMLLYIDESVNAGRRHYDVCTITYSHHYTDRHMIYVRRDVSISNISTIVQHQALEAHDLNVAFNSHTHLTITSARDNLQRYYMGYTKDSFRFPTRHCTTCRNIVSAASFEWAVNDSTDIQIWKMRAYRRLMETFPNAWTADDW